MFIFKTTEEKWFVSWVVMRRKFKEKQRECGELLMDNIKLTKRHQTQQHKINTLEETIGDLTKENTKMQRLLATKVNSTTFRRLQDFIDEK